MASESEPLEYYFASGSLYGLIRSGLTLIRSRRIRARSGRDSRALSMSAIGDQILYVLLVAIPAVVLTAYQTIRYRLTGEPSGFPLGTWQFYLQFGLREDLAHHTNETIGYEQNRPAEATDLDDLTAWIMTVIQFLWGYEDLMGVVWDEWVTLRLVAEAANEYDLGQESLFKNILRQWEIARPYSAPLNGTYADVRRGAFEQFITPRLNALPHNVRNAVSAQFQTLAASRRDNFEKQMSLLNRTVPGQYMDTIEPIPLWDAWIGLVLGGQYHLISVVARDDNGVPVAYGPGGKRWAIKVVNGVPCSPSGEKLVLHGVQLFRQTDQEWMGYLDMASASYVKGQIKTILNTVNTDLAPGNRAVDVLLAEAPRRDQRHLRRLLPQKTQASIKMLTRTPIIVNWDTKARDASLAQLRRSQRGIGDHALTIMRADKSMIFDQSHIFFDGTWAMAMAEVLTTAAVQWCKRCITIAPGEAPALKPLRLEGSPSFINAALPRQQTSAVSAETTIYDISLIFQLRDMLAKTGTRLTVNDLLVITRIFHAAHYRPSAAVQPKIDAYRNAAQSPAEKKAISAIEHSIQRGRLRNPALLIPVDASIVEPHERIFPITFRNLADSLVWVWDDTWESYQAYRKIEPPDTPEGVAALKAFALKRTFLIGNLRAFSYILAANKTVAMRGESINIAVLQHISHLPVWMQYFLNAIPEQLPVLNEIIKGDEVYSNVGRVAKGSSITRFMSAKDDGNTKMLVWGVMTDDNNRLIVTMRDFRPHVRPLIEAGSLDLAQALAQDYVVSYTADLIGLVARLSAMLQVETS
jgi:hypothetical protein